MFDMSPVVVVLMVLVGVLTACVLLLASRRPGAAPSRGEAGAARADARADGGGSDVVEAGAPDEVPFGSQEGGEPDYRRLAETRRRQLVEAELRTLRAQISPHFIYNSLNAIAAFIPTEPVRARELVIDFADFTRYSLRAEGDFSTLAEELDAVERYVVLEKARFGERVQVDLQIAPEVLGVRIPFLAVQPLVENAVRHGLEAESGQVRVLLRAVDEATHAAISVEDDGVGAEPEHMAEVLAGEAGGSHIGLRNVDLRLRQAYGGGQGLVIDTAVGAGMMVSMRIPKFQPEAHVDTEVAAR
ncbi:two-component system LytT family sensor kinase [Nesterenkonia xinjiangensis]|uniref:Two-component system LytT family sensor kinase n=1 Tax=Nesterenkonia xinjiangensis TaxID=225327 RepID=A0A7Z0GN34_9MICC|nr:two-component system LytT family sensor kinase [Nesterenkonia xinjiangensis]